jgi:hypothetical protein
LEITGVREDRQRDRAPEEPIPVLKRKSQESYDKGEYEDTIITARSILDREPVDRDAMGLLKKSEDKLSDSYYEKFFKKDDIPYLKQSLEELIKQSFSVHETFIISRINGSWDIQTIVKICPLKECDILRILKGLMSKDVIGLKSPETSDNPS